MGKKPAISVSKLIEALKCPRCAWFMIHAGLSFSDEHFGAVSRNKQLIRERYDLARRKHFFAEEFGHYPKSILRLALLVDQATADRLRYRLHYFDKQNNFTVRGQIDDAFFFPAKGGYMPIRISFPGSEDKEIGKLEQAKFDESVRLMQESGFRVLDRGVKISYFAAPGSRDAWIRGWRCEVCVVDTSRRRSVKLHRLMGNIVKAKTPPHASKTCGRHRLVGLEMRLRNI